MGTPKMTQAEADRLLQMVKRSLISELTFPSAGEKEEFNVQGDTSKDIFTISIFRGKINAKKYNIGARITKDGVMLLELHINPSNVHQNPNDGPKIYGNHWHIYTEEHNRELAFPAEDINSENFVENTISFLTKFNVIEQPAVYYQMDMT